MTKRIATLDQIHPIVRERVVDILTECRAVGLKVGVFETFRTRERQNQLLAKGRSKTVNSYHRLGLAVDIVFTPPYWSWAESNDWDTLNAIMEKHGLASLRKQYGWDGPHCDLRIPGVSAAELFKQLAACDNNVKLFWKKHVDPFFPTLNVEKAGQTPKTQVESIPAVPSNPIDPIPMDEGRDPLKDGFWANLLKTIRSWF